MSSPGQSKVHVPWASASLITVTWASEKITITKMYGT